MWPQAKRLASDSTGPSEPFEQCLCSEGISVASNCSSSTSSLSSSSSSVFRRALCSCRCCLCLQRGAAGSLPDEDDIYDSVRRSQKPLVTSLSGGAGNGASETILEGPLYKRKCARGEIPRVLSNCALGGLEAAFSFCERAV